MWLFAAAFHCLSRALRAQNGRARGKLRSGAVWNAASFALPAAVCLAVAIGMNMGGQSAPWESAPAEPSPEIAASVTNAASPVAPAETAASAASIQDGFIFIKGGSFAMGSPEDEPWRSADETQHTVSVSDFYISPYELRQSEYAEVMGENPSSFTGGDLPVESVSWLDAMRYCNARSERDGLECVSKRMNVQVRADLAAIQGSFPQACRGKSRETNAEVQPKTPKMRVQDFRNTL